MSLETGRLLLDILMFDIFFDLFYCSVIFFSLSFRENLVIDLSGCNMAKKKVSTLIITQIRIRSI